MDQGERPAHALISDAVGRYLKAIFEESNAPADEDDHPDAGMLKPFHFPELQVPVPGQRHEGVGEGQEYQRGECFHTFSQSHFGGLQREITG